MSRARSRRVHGDCAFTFKPITKSQQQAVDEYAKSEVLFLLGPAGSGKTFTAVGMALNDTLAGRYERVVITRPLVEAGEHLGFLPGEISAKVEPFMMPIYDVAAKMAYKLPEEIFEIAPLAYLRGRSLDSCVAILDEASNATYAQLKLFLTRLGCKSKLIIAGDPDQTDLDGTCALSEVVKKLKGVQGVSIVYFPETDIVRNPLITRILKRL